MEERVTKKDGYKGYTTALFVFLVVMAVSILVFFYYVQKDVNRNTKKTIMGHMERQGFHLQSILDIEYEYLEGIADFIGRKENLTDPDNMQLLRDVSQKGGLQILAVIDEQGQIYYDTGARKDVSSREYFQEAMRGNRTLSDPLESKLDGRQRVIMGVPIYREEKVTGVLAGSCDVTALSHMLFDDLYDGQGYPFIVTEKGEVVSLDQNQFYSDIAAMDNFFDYCADLNFLNRGSLEDTRLDFTEQKSGHVEFRKDGSSHYLAYMPVHLNTWMLCYVVPDDTAKGAYHFIDRYELILIGVLTVAVLILLWTIARMNSLQQKDLLLYAQTDDLTGVLNKKGTEEKIDQWLGEEYTGNQAFLMLDIDKFKEINDIYGHAVGDEVLRRVGEVLRRQFRETDILGRIGGDEFVVLMKNINTKKHAEARARNLAESIRRIEIPTIKDYTITSSMGLTFAPQHGQSFEELYICADIALYETKRNGRDGCTMYDDIKE